MYPKTLKSLLKIHFLCVLQVNCHFPKEKKKRGQVPDCVEYAITFFQGKDFQILN